MHTWSSVFRGESGTVTIYSEMEASMNPGTFVVLLVLVLVVSLALVKIVRDRKRGKTSCGGDCSACALHCPAQDPKRLSKEKNA